MSSTAFDDPPSRFKRWFIGRFKTWPKFHFGPLANSELTVFVDLKFDVAGVYGVSFAGGFVGFMRLKYRQPTVIP